MDRFSSTRLWLYNIRNHQIRDLFWRHSGAVGFWNTILQAVEVVPFDDASVNTAVEVNAVLKSKRKQIELADLFIAATAISNNLPLATLNRKHFDRIDRLHIIE